MFSRAPVRRLSGVLRRLPVLGIRDFQLLLADRLLAPAAFAFSLVGVSFAVLDTTRSTADLSYVLAAQIVPSLIFTLVGGVIADRIRPQLVIIAGNLMIALGEGTFGILVLAGHPRLWQMIVLETVTGTGMAIFYPASQALLPQAGARPPAAAGQRDQPAGHERRPDGRRGAGRPSVAVLGPGWALVDLRRRHARHGAADAAPCAWSRTSGPVTAACCATCATAGPSSARTPGCGRSWLSSA